MIVYKEWGPIVCALMPRRKYVGWFLFGIIPLYLKQR